MMGERESVRERESERKRESERERESVREPETTFEWTIQEPFYKFRNEFTMEFSLNSWECLQWRLEVETIQCPYEGMVMCTLFYITKPHPEKITADVSATLTLNGGATVHVPGVRREFKNSLGYSFHGAFDGVHRGIETEFRQHLVISLVIKRCRDERRQIRENHWGDLQTLEKLSNDLGSLYERGLNPTLILIGVDRAEMDASILEQLDADTPKPHHSRGAPDSQEESTHFLRSESFPRDEKETAFLKKLDEEDVKKNKESGWKMVEIHYCNAEYENELDTAIQARDKALPSTKFRKFKVHHAILEKRWPKYFIDHKLAFRRVYDTWIQSNLLNEILHYVYTGEYTPDYSESGTSEPNSKLKEILLETGLEYVYRRNQCLTKVCCQTVVGGFYMISYVDLRIGTLNRSIRRPLHPLVGAETPYFEIKEGRYNRRPWLFYSISGMPSPCEVYIHLVIGAERSIPVHIHDHAVGEDGRVESGPVLYLGSLATFGDYSQVNKLHLCFEVRFGGTLRRDVQRAFLADVSVMDYGIRSRSSLFKLSDDMRSVLDGQSFTETDVFLGDVPEGMYYKHAAHRAILAARVPESMILGQLHGRRLQLGWPILAESLTTVLSFIYTGEARIVPDDYFIDDIYKFAKLHDYRDLISLMEHGTNVLYRLSLEHMH